MKRLSRFLTSHSVTVVVFLAPSILGFLVFMLFPIVASFLISLTHWDIITPPKFVGFHNYLALLKDPLFYKYFGNTLFYMLAIPVQMFLALLLAVLLNRGIRGLSFFRAVYFLPVVTTTVAVALLWQWIYDPEFGILNFLLSKLGIHGPMWLASPTWAKPAIMLMGVWKGLGYDMLIYLAGLQNIPRQYYESAAIDGAGSVRSFLHITLPLLFPVHFFLLIMHIIWGFQIFDAVYIMTDGGPAGSTEPILMYLYQNAFRWGKMGYASAIAWLLTVIIFLVTVINWWLSRKRMEYGVDRKSVV